MLVSSYLTDWLDGQQSRLRPASVASYRVMIATYLVPHVGDCEVAVLDRPVIERLAADLRRAGGQGGAPLSTKTVRSCLGILRQALDLAVADGRLAANPARGVAVPRAGEPAQAVSRKLAVWTASEASTFLAAVEHHPWRALWHLAVGTGARRAELLGVQWHDVDLDGGKVRFCRTLSRGGGVTTISEAGRSRARSLCVQPSVVDALQRHDVTAPGRDGLLFRRVSGQPLEPNLVTNEFRMLTRVAAVPPIRMQDLAHTQAALLIEAGMPIDVVSHRLGHATIATTMDVYGHLLPDLDASAAERLGSMIADRPHPKP